MKEFKEYLENQFIKYSLKGNIFEIGGETFSVSEYSKTVINEDFELVNKPNEYSDYYVFKFGGKWYYTPSDEKKVTLNRFINIGTYDGSDTEVFLGVHGGFEIMNGSGLYDSWCKRAKFLRTNYLGICEKNTLAGVMKFQQECLKQNLVPIIGATFTVRRISPEIIYDIKCFVKNDKGWGNLLRINYHVNVVNNGFIDEPEFIKLLEGVKVVLDPKSLKFKDIFPYDLKDFYYQLDTVIFDDENVDREYLDNLKDYFNSSGEPLPFTDAYYTNKEDFKVKEILNKVASKFDLKSSNQYFKSKDDYFYELNGFIKSDVRLVDLIQRLLRNEKDFVGDIGFKVETGVRHLPRYIMTPIEASKYKSNEDLFWGLISEGLSRLNLGQKDIQIYMDRIEKEVSVIEKGNVLDYFLILHDIISWCKRNDILVGVGRGSAGGSLVSYCLGLIHLDPLEFDLLFERFLNEGRLVKSIPDIDVDFESRRRGDIKSYMEKRFGELQVISIGTYTALQLRACIKDIGRVFNLTFDETNKVTAFLGEANSFHSLIEIATKDKLIRNFVIENTELVNYIPLIHGQPKARSVHACAMVIFPSDKTMFEWAPIYKHDDILVSEWEGEEIEKAGFLKEDILGVAQLDKFRMVLDLIKRHHGVDVNIYTIPYDDEKVYRLFRKGFNSDIFHFGSRGLTKYCTELLPGNIEDLVAGISLYRPGAIENNFHNQYVLRKHGEQEVTYPIGAEEILSKTYGVFVYQEQIMKLCQVLGGLSLVEADDVRKAMVKKRYDELNKYKERFIPYYIDNFRVSEEYAIHVWDQIDKASTYLFNRSHAAAYAITGYIGQWFKVNYPIEFWTTAFNFISQDDINKGVLSNYLSEVAKTNQIEVVPVEINGSSIGVSTDSKKVFWSISSVKQVGEISSKQIIEDRERNGKYFSFEEFISRHNFIGSKVNKSVIENLTICGSFDLIEGIKHPSERIRLIRYYREFKGIKPSDNDWLVTDERLYEDWWWSLKQKELSGISFFDYRSMCDKYLKDSSYVDQNEFQSKTLLQKKYYSIGGIVTDVMVRNSKTKGKYCFLTIESNYELITISIFPDMYKKIKELGIDIENSKGSILLCTGLIKYDDYRKENVLKIWDSSEINLL